jgi:hypothetical protein
VMFMSVPPIVFTVSGRLSVSAAAGTHGGAEVHCDAVVGWTIP